MVSRGRMFILMGIVGCSILSMSSCRDGNARPIIGTESVFITTPTPASYEYTTKIGVK